MGKRKGGQGRDDKASSDAKRRRSRHYQNGETSRPSDGTPLEGFADVFREAVIEIKDAIHDKVSKEAKFNRKIVKLKKKRRKDKEDIRILKEDIRVLKEGHEDLKSKIQEMRKEGYAEVDHFKASPSERSQLSQSTRFRLVIENRVSTPIYKNETIETEDYGGHIKVIMCDGGNPIANDHPLASVKVDLVLIEGRFNEPKRDSWSKEEFEKSMITPREGIIRLVKNGTFDLIRGRGDHQGAIITDNSQKKEVKLGVMIAVHTEVRVLEGVSNPFRVQEGKTKRSQKKGKQPSPVPTQILGQSTSAYSTQHGQGPVSPVSQHSSPPQVIQDVLQTAVNQHLPAHGHDQCTSFANGSSELAHQNPSAYDWLNDILLTLSPEDVHNLNGQTQMQEAYESFRCGQVLLQWDKPHVELSERWNFLDQLRPLYSTKSRFYSESFPSTNLMDKAHKLLASISSAGSVWKMITSVTSRAQQTPEKRGVLIRPIEPYDSDNEPAPKKQRNARYQLRFVNRVCSDYYTREQIKSEDGTFLKIALYDENNLVVTSGPLSSALVEVVLLHGDFNAEDQDHWTTEEFSVYSLPTDGNFFPGEVPPVFGGDRVLALTDGEADLANINFLIPSFLARTGKFKMGVEIKNLREESSRRNH